MPVSGGNSTESEQPGVVRTAVALARACGVSEKSVSTWKKSPTFPKRQGGGWSVWEVGVWYWTFGPGAAKKALAGDPELVGEKEDSPGLERFRDARAAQEEIKLEEMKRSVVSVAWVHDRLSEIASIIRGIGEQLEREFGGAALRILDDGLSEAEGRISQLKDGKS